MKLASLIKAVAETLTDLEDAVEETKADSGQPPKISPAKKAEQSWPTQEHRRVEPTHPPKEGHRVNLGEQ